VAEANLTPRQQKWFASVRAGLERDTGKTLAQWVAIAGTCPEAGHRARLRWFKDNHGLLQNRASLVLSEALGGKAWDEPRELIDALWWDPPARAIFEAVDAAAGAGPGVFRSARKSYTAWSCRVQFAALRPVKGGEAMLGLALAPHCSPRLEPPRNESWSERLKARTALTSPGDVDPEIVALLRAARERS